MKKIILMIVSLLFIQYSYSQEQESEYAQLRRKFQHFTKSGEAKGIDNKYDTDTVSTLCSMLNKKTSKEISAENKSDPTYKVIFASREILNNILKKNLSACVDFESLQGREFFYLIFNANLSGKIETTAFMYPHRLNIPVVVIEQIEKDIKKQCRLEFDRKSPAFMNTKCVMYTCTVFLKECCL